MRKSLIHREGWGVAQATYGRMGGAGRRRMGGLTSAPHALDLAFLPHRRTVVQREGGRVEERAIHALTGGAVGSEAVRFLETDGPSEFVEVRPAAWLRREVIADLRAEGVAEHERQWDRADPALFAMGSRVRAHALGGAALSSLELEGLARNALARSLEAAGARPRPKAVRGLDARRTRRVLECIEAHLDGDLRLGRLADVAAVSRHHFARMFARTVGLPPHAYVTARRMERTAAALRADAGVAAAARAAGHAPGHSFRAAFAAQFGRPPARYARMARTNRAGPALGG